MFAPLASWSNDWWGWRGTYLLLLVILVTVTVPLHWWGLDRPWRASTHGPEDGRRDGTLPAEQLRRVVLSRPFILLTLALSMTSMTIYAGIINQVPLLVAHGMSPNLAAVTLGVTGVGQVLGRLGFATLAARTSATTRTVAVMLAVAATTATLAVAPASTPLLLAVAAALGLARGIETLIQATAITDRWGPHAHGALNGILTAPSLAAAAVAPFAGAALAHLLGSYGDAFLVLAGLAALAAALAAGATPQPQPHRQAQETPPGSASH